MKRAHKAKSHMQPSRSDLAIIHQHENKSQVKINIEF